MVPEEVQWCLLHHPHPYPSPQGGGDPREHPTEGMSEMPWSQAPAKPIPAHAATNGKLLRRRLTESEKRLWWHLRHRLPIEGSHFRRQVPIGRYVADFCCLAERLIIEVDGGGHGHDAQIAHDARRTATLGAQGYRILRFTNAEVMRSIDAVLATIFAALSPPPCGEGSGVGVVPLASATDGIEPNPGETPRPHRTPAASGGTTPTSSFSPQGGGECPES